MFAVSALEVATLCKFMKLLVFLSLKWGAVFGLSNYNAAYKVRLTGVRAWHSSIFRRSFRTENKIKSPIKKYPKTLRVLEQKRFCSSENDDGERMNTNKASKIVKQKNEC